MLTCYQDVRCSSHQSGSLQNRLRDRQTCGMTLASAYMLHHHVVATSDDEKKSKIGISANWYVTIEHQRSSSIRVIFVDYQTSKLQCNY